MWEIKYPKLSSIFIQIVRHEVPRKESPWIWCHEFLLEFHLFFRGNYFDSEDECSRFLHEISKHSVTSKKTVLSQITINPRLQLTSFINQYKFLKPFTLTTFLEVGSASQLNCILLQASCFLQRFLFHSYLYQLACLSNNVPHLFQVLICSFGILRSNFEQ